MRNDAASSSAIACCSGTLVWKAAGGRKVPAGSAIGQAVRSIFDRQGQVSNPTAFHQWDQRLAAALEPKLLNLLKREAAKAVRESEAEVDTEVLAAELVRLARIRALETAASVNRTSADRVSEEDPFTTDRAAAIGLNEAHWATFAAEGAVLSLAKEEWEWVTDPKKPCDHCQRLAGRKRKPGKSFGTIDGKPVFHAPAHPHCRCSMKRVGRK